MSNIKKLTIALIAPLEEPVPPRKYGGTELVVSNLAETLVAEGHEVHLFASGNSVTSAHLHPIFPRSIREEPQADDARMRELLKYIGMSKILRSVTDIAPDIIHNHVGWRFIAFENMFSAPMITTLHGPLDVPAQRAIFEMFPTHRYISISDSQRSPAPTLNYLSTVYNGIDISKFTFNSQQGEYLAFLGRMSPEKGPLQAIAIAKASGMKLKMAAKVDAVDKDFFEKEIKPHIDNDQIIFLGEVGPEEKDNLLSNAYALIGPIQWREPFGLFMIEAMACGTPVVVTNLGSAPEIVVQGKTGFVVENTTQAFVDALKKIPSLHREDCRAHVEQHFTKEVMAQGYLDAYRKSIGE